MNDENKLKDTEDQKIDDALESSRRDFLKKVGLVGAASVAGAAAVYSGYQFEKKKHSRGTVRVLTDDNRLVEVPVEEVKDIKRELKVLQTQGREGIKGKKMGYGYRPIKMPQCKEMRKCMPGCSSPEAL